MADGADRDKRAPSPLRQVALWAPVAFGCGIQLFFLSPWEPSVALLILAALAPAALALAAFGRGLGAVLATALLALALWGFAAAGARARLVAAPVLAGPVEALVEGRVATLSASAAGFPRLTLDGPRIWGLPAQATPARVRVTLLARQGAAGVRPGDWVSVMATLSPPGGPAEPGAFDFARAAWFDRLGGVGVARGRLVVIGGSPPDDLADRVALSLERARLRLSAALRAAAPGETGSFIAALVVGDASGLSPQTLDALRDSNLAHILSISGLHMAIVAGMAFTVVRAALALVPGLALRGPIKAWAAVAALLAATAYLALSGGSVATQRAYVMAAVAFAAVLAGRPAVTLRALALAALIVLAGAPESLLNAGFQMSFAATLALVAAYEAARERGWLAPRPGLARRLAAYAVGVIATSLVAGLATGPFAAFHFNRTTSYGLLANALAVPVTGLWVAPALAVAGVMAPFGMERWPLAAAGAGVDWILAVAAWVAALPGAARPVAAAPPAALWAIALGGLALCLGYGRLRLAGALGVALGWALMAWTPARPDALVALAQARGGLGVAAGVLAPLGRAVSAPRGADFAAETWLRRDGDAADMAQAAERPGFVAEGAWRVAALPSGGALHLHAGRPPSATALATRCAPGAVLVLAHALPTQTGPCALLDRAALEAAGGAAAILPGPRIVPAAGQGRLWRP